MKMCVAEPTIHLDGKSFPARKKIRKIISKNL
jgi:hypothetical protein